MTSVELYKYEVAFDFNTVEEAKAFVAERCREAHNPNTVVLFRRLGDMLLLEVEQDIYIIREDKP